MSGAEGPVYQLAHLRIVTEVPVSNLGPSPDYRYRNVSWIRFRQMLETGHCLPRSSYRLSFEANKSQS